MNAARQSQANSQLDPDATAGMQQGFRTPSIGEMSRIFPDLEILQLVGRGGMGAVYRVRQKNLDRIVALKVFLYKPDDPEFAARFVREARALAKLNHPNIVTVHDFGERENLHFLLMEFVDGLNLRQVTSEERLSPEMALQMVPQLCDALQYAHDQGVIHRDIKPENLLLDQQGRIKIADFGLAKMTGSGNNGTLTHTRQVMGTLNYMAPEQRERPTEVDHRADIYSLGVVIYELLTGELPLGRFQPPSVKSDVDTRLDEVVLRALEKEPELRYQQASEFKTCVETAGVEQASYEKAYVEPGNEIHAAVAQNDGYLPARAPIQPVKSSVRTASRDSGSTIFTVMSGREKKGRWRPGDPQNSVTFMGGTCLNLTEIDSEEVRLNLFTLMGATEVIVPHGAIVDVDGFILMGSTVDNVVASSSPTNMRVKIQNWGLMGGMEVRTPKESELPLANTPSEKVRQLAQNQQIDQAIATHQKETGASDVAARKVVAAARNPHMYQYREPIGHEFTIKNGIVYAYKTFAAMVGLAALIVFLLSRFRLIDRNEGLMTGIILGIACFMFWCGLGYFRRIIGAGPEDNEPETLKNYYSSSFIGTLIRTLGMASLFACAILYVVSKFESSDEDDFRFAAICCAIGSGVIYTIAHYVEEFFYGKLKE